MVFTFRQALNIFKLTQMRIGLEILMTGDLQQVLQYFFCDNPVAWGAKKQSTVSGSSTEAKYRALATRAAELSWLRMLLCDLQLFISSPPIIFCDNISALSLASNPLFHAKTKHIEIDYHFVREKVTRKDLEVSYVSTEDQLANVFTKGLSSSGF